MTIAKLYENHKNGKVSKQSFLYEARKDANLPWVNNFTSYEDAVKILKNKRIISERDMTDLTANGASGPTGQKINMQGDAYSSNAEVNEEAITIDGKTVKDYIQNGDKSYTVTYEDDTQDTIFVNDDNWDIINDEMRNRRALNEAHDLTTAQIIDRLNVYEFKRGVDYEMSKLKVLDNISYEKVREKVAKKMAKDPLAYRYTQLANAKQIEKDDKRLAMKPVKGDNFVDKDNEMKKIKGYADEKKNTSTPKTENKKGKPKGVKEMKGSKKKPSGVQTMMESSIRQDVVSELTNFFKKKINISENTIVPAERTDYNKGTKIITPEGEGTVTEVNGSVIHYELDGGIEGSKTLNVIDKLNSKNQSPEEMKKAQDAKDKEERDKMWANWDKRGEKTFGGMLTDPEYFKKPLDYKNLMEKIKTVLNKLKLKKESGVEIKPAGGSPKYVKTADVANAEKELKAAGITNFTKKVVG